nr:DUF4377 domain-containing protein [uncultured Carboxylicivirga sp.]
MKYLPLISIFIILVSCQTAKKQINSPELSTYDIKTYYVAPVKVSCTGVAPTSCLLVKSKMESPWKYFYGNIEGFNHQFGQTYIIKVKETNIENPPADASSIKYELMEITEQRATEQEITHLYDIYGIISINNKQIPKGIYQTLEINTTEMTFMGQAACNHYNGKLKATTGWNGINFVQMINTEMYCNNQKTEDEYLKTLQSVTSYYKFNNTLLLFNGNEVVIEARHID